MNLVLLVAVWAFTWGAGLTALYVLESGVLAGACMFLAWLLATTVARQVLFTLAMDDFGKDK